MTWEQNPREAQKRYFSPLEARMISWMVFDYNENHTGNANKLLAGALNIGIQVVEGALKRLEERTGLQMTQAMILVVKTAVLNNELIGSEKKFDMPEPSLGKKEQLLKREFFNGSNTSQICETLNLTVEEFKKLKNKLFRKFGTKNRFFIVAYDTAQRLRNK